MKKLVVIDKASQTLSKIYFIADVKKYQVVTLNDFSDTITTLKNELPDVLIVNCDLYKGDFSAFIHDVKKILPDIHIVGCSWRTARTFQRKGTPFALDAFIKMPMDVRKISLALEAIEYNYALFPVEMFSHG